MKVDELIRELQKYPADAEVKYVELVDETEGIQIEKPEFDELGFIALRHE